MTWYNPFSWFTAAKAEVEKIEEEAKEVVISLEKEAAELVTGFQKFATTSANQLASIKTRLEADIQKKQAALDAVNGELSKAQSVVPPPTPVTAPQPEQPAAQ
jgi:hypothetical protein